LRSDNQELYNRRNWLDKPFVTALFAILHFSFNNLTDLSFFAKDGICSRSPRQITAARQVLGQDVFVLGAGIGGLVSASILLKQGARNVIVVDEYARVGGNHIDCRIGEYTFDIGSLYFKMTRLTLCTLARRTNGRPLLLPITNVRDRVNRASGRLRLPADGPFTTLEAEIALSRRSAFTGSGL
jgi:hypothetical protein